MKLYRYFILLLLIVNCDASFSQSFDPTFQNDHAWYIKQIDQFIETFNNKDETVKMYKKNNQNPDLGREKMLISLFNFKNKNWNIKEIKSFINEIDNKKRPVYLNFFDQDWCAKLICAVTWDGKPETVLLTLKIKKFPDESSKWVITGVSAQFLKRQRLIDSMSNRPLNPMPIAKNHTTSLHPYSHSTSFMNIDQVSRDKVNIVNYFETPNDPRADELLPFMYEIIGNRLTIKRPVSLSYEFYQVKGWSFEVSDFGRESSNSGWLISKISRLSISLHQ